MDDPLNPYQAPLTEVGAYAQRFGPNDETIKFLRRFRNDIHVLGLLWLVVGVINGASCVWVLDMLRAHGVGVRGADMLALVIVVAWFLLAALTLAKQAWAVAAGLGLWSLTAIGALAAAIQWGGEFWALPTWVATILPAALVQGIRVQRRARELQYAGIPLTLKPSQVMEFFATPGVLPERDRTSR